MKPETVTMNQIRIALSDYAIVFRINVGLFLTVDGRKTTTGVPKGFSDLFGVRKSDGRAFFIECKTQMGKATKEQVQFLSAMRSAGAITGICRSVDEAIDLIKTAGERKAKDG